MANKFGKTKPVVVHENNHGNTKLADTKLKLNNNLGVNIVEEKEGWFYGWADTYDEWNNYYYTPTEENNRRAHTRSQVTTAFLNSPKPSTTGEGNDCVGSIHILLVLVCQRRKGIKSMISN